MSTAGSSYLEPPLLVLLERPRSFSGLLERTFAATVVGQVFGEKHAFSSCACG